MDWKGQKLAEQIMQYSLIAAAILALVAGYFMSSFKITLMIYGGAVLITLLILVPDWAYFNRHPLKWLEPKAADPLGDEAQKARFHATTKNLAKSVKK